MKNQRSRTCYAIEHGKNDLSYKLIRIEIRDCRVVHEEAVIEEILPVVTSLLDTYVLREALGYGKTH